MNKSDRWRMGALATTVVVLGCLASLDAHALALGGITVQSALGEPLRAEIDIADINADEASSLKAGVASAETFKAAGFDYGSVVAGVQVNLQRRADGRAFLRLTSSRPVIEPFVDLIIQANWSSGRITHDYTMLFDPPSVRTGGGAIAPTAPIIARPASPVPEVAAPARATARPVTPPSPIADRSEPIAKAPASQARLAGKEPASDKQVTVKAGDTAGKIATQNKSANVSLEQMLVALLANNPDAFIGGNVNRVRAGAVLDIPGTEAASAIDPSEATQTIVAQSKDFNAFRRKLAEGAPSAQLASADRQSGGKVQAKVEDRAPASVAPDKLTLSKGAVQGKSAAAAEDIVARERRAKDDATRVAELSKNISDLNKLEASPALTPRSSTSPKAPSVTVPKAAPPAPAAAPVAAPAPAASSTKSAGGEATAIATAPAAAASVDATAPALVSKPASAPSAIVAPAAVAPKKPVAAPPMPSPAEPSLIDDLLDNPMALPLAGVLLALLAGFGYYRYRQRNNATQVDSSFLESRLQPDSFFGASGGQRIDTNDGNVTGSSLVYSPSQLDAAGDVDPVAEADVYLAYGRDLQAEEILKEALRTSPTRVAIHAKLMEIYAKRRDNKAFEALAVEAFNLTHGSGPEWAYITEMGRELDPANPVYQQGTQAVAASSSVNVTALSPSGAVAQAVQAGAAGPSPTTPPVVDVDLDLDFPASDTPDMATTPAAITAQLPATPEQAAEPAMAMDWDTNLDDLNAAMGAATAALPATSPSGPSAKSAGTSTAEIDFPSDGLTFTPEPFSKPKPIQTRQAAAASDSTPSDAGMLEFDMNSLSLDLSGPTTESPSHAVTGMSSDPLETRFLLAEEFRALGDTDGARSLAEEVLAKSSGPLKVKAQAFLNALS